MPAKSKLTQERIDRLISAIQIGATYEMACQYAGITYRAFRKWMERGESAGRGLHRRLFEAITEAEGRACVSWLAQIEDAASNGNWQAAAWKLERRYPKDFARNRLEITGPDGQPILHSHEHHHNIEVKQLDPHDAEKTAKILSVMDDLGLFKGEPKQKLIEAEITDVEIESTD